MNWNLIIKIMISLITLRDILENNNKWNIKIAQDLLVTWCCLMFL